MSKINDWFINFNIANEVFYCVKENTDHEYGNGKGCGAGCPNDPGEENCNGYSYEFIRLCLENGGGLGNGFNSDTILENGYGSGYEDGNGFGFENGEGYGYGIDDAHEEENGSGYGYCDGHHFEDNYFFYN